MSLPVRLNQATMHVEASSKVSQDAGSIPAASTQANLRVFASWLYSWIDPECIGFLPRGAFKKTTRPPILEWTDLWIHLRAAATYVDHTVDTAISLNCLSHISESTPFREARIEKSPLIPRLRAIRSRMRPL